MHRHAYERGKFCGPMSHVKYSQRLLKLKSTSSKNIIHELMNYTREKR